MCWCWLHHGFMAGPQGLTIRIANSGKSRLFLRIFFIFFIKVLQQNRDDEVAHSAIFFFSSFSQSVTKIFIDTDVE